MLSLILLALPVKSSAHWLSEQQESVTRCAMLKAAFAKAYRLDFSSFACLRILWRAPLVHYLQITYISDSDVSDQ